jgi:hypothetical protein
MAENVPRGTQSPQIHPLRDGQEVWGCGKTKKEFFKIEGMTPECV